jgi:hypothetical protein
MEEIMFVYEFWKPENTSQKLYSNVMVAIKDTEKSIWSEVNEAKWGWRR